MEGTERMPRDLARLATLISFISWTVTSQDGHAARLTVSITSLQAAQPALKTSILRFAGISIAPVGMDGARSLHLGVSSRVKRRHSQPVDRNAASCCPLCLPPS